MVHLRKSISWKSFNIPISTPAPIHNIGIFGLRVVAFSSRHDNAWTQMKKCTNNIKEFRVGAGKPNSFPDFVLGCLAYQQFGGGGKQKGQWPFYLALHSSKTHLRWNRFKQCISIKFSLGLLFDGWPSSWKVRLQSLLLDQISVPFKWNMMYFISFTCFYMFLLLLG